MASPFQLLLNHLDPDEEQASKKYLALQSKIVKIAIWKRHTQLEAEEIADTVIDRITQKIKEGTNIEDVNKYANSVLKFIILEYSRKIKLDTVGDDLPEIPVQPEIKSGKSLRMVCLEKCMLDAISVDQDRYLIISYYDVDSYETNKDHRKKLAMELGMTMNNLKVKASRLRDRLEKCINECLAKLDVTKSSKRNTYDQGGEKG